MISASKSTHDPATWIPAEVLCSKALPYEPVDESFAQWRRAQMLEIHLEWYILKFRIVTKSQPCQSSLVARRERKDVLREWLFESNDSLENDVRWRLGPLWPQAGPSQPGPRVGSRKSCQIWYFDAFFQMISASKSTHDPATWIPAEVLCSKALPYEPVDESFAQWRRAQMLEIHLEWYILKFRIVTKSQPCQSSLVARRERKDVLREKYL